MTHCGNHGNGTFVNGARHRFLIEIPQILNGAASASYNEHVHGRETVEGRSGPSAHGCGYFVLRSCPLHAYGQQISLHPRGAAFQYVPYVLDDGAGGGGDDADGAGERGNFLFVFRVKQPLALEFGFQLQKASLQISLSCSFYLPDDQLELPPVRVYGGAAQDMDFHPFLEPYGAFGSRCLEKGAENFRSLFLQGEINVAAGVMLDVAQFSHHPLGAHSDADRVSQAVNELFDCDGFGRGGRFLREFHKLRFKGDVQRFIR